MNDEPNLTFPAELNDGDCYCDYADDGSLNERDPSCPTHSDTPVTTPIEVETSGIMATPRGPWIDHMFCNGALREAREREATLRADAGALYRALDNLVKSGTNAVDRMREARDVLAYIGRKYDDA